MSELILGGQKSGKSRRAEMLAAQWLAQSPDRRAVLLATGLAFDAEMQQRIARHQADRAERAPRLETLEEPLDLAAAVLRHSGPETLLLVDCLTLWLTNLTMPAHGEAASPELPIAALLEALRIAPGPVILVSNEIGMGVIPMGQQVRSFVDALGNLHQQVAAQCQRVTLMVAGFPVFVRDVA